MDRRLFPVYLSCTYFCISLFMRKIRIFIRIFLLVPANRRKYVILGTRKVQSVKTGTSNAEAVIRVSFSHFKS